MVRNKTILFQIIIYLVPALVFAEEKISSLQDFLSVLYVLINWAIITVIIPLALLFFLWGLTGFIINSGDEKKRAIGKQSMVWGIIILTVMVGVWGIIKILQNAIFGDSFIDQPPF